MNALIARTLVLLLLTATALHAQEPRVINYQGRVAVGGVNFNGAGQFKFALVDAEGITTYWSNDGTAGSEPAAAVTLTVTGGLYSVLLGDTTLPNMAAIPESVFNNPEVYLRVWFDDGTAGSQLLTPDQRLRMDCAATTADAWQQRFNGTSPTAREDHTAVWTGSTMIVWGGLSDNASYVLEPALRSHIGNAHTTVECRKKDSALTMLG
jgi:hypothetical protein